MTDWIARYFALAEHVATWSKDPRTKVGAVLVGRDHRKIAVGYNGFPEGISDDDRLDDRATKNLITCHAERNVLDQCSFDAQGATLAVTMHPCHECAKSILSKRIGRVICPPIPDDLMWEDSASLARKMFDEAGVDVVTIWPPSLGDDELPF